jgi:hypothetical protein
VIDPALLIPPHRRAKERLRGATELLSDPYAFCSLVSDVTRVYLEERFNLHAPDRTTEEFLDELRNSSRLNDEHKALFENFLMKCDLVKFAREEPTEPELRGLLDAALRLIDETREVVVTVENQAMDAAKDVSTDGLCTTQTSRSGANRKRRQGAALKTARGQVRLGQILECAWLATALDSAPVAREAHEDARPPRVSKLVDDHVRASLAFVVAAGHCRWRPGCARARRASRRFSIRQCNW